jgi:hypothetical protein
MPLPGWLVPLDQRAQLPCVDVPEPDQLAGWGMAGLEDKAASWSRLTLNQEA